MRPPYQIRQFQHVDFATSWQEMQKVTTNRSALSPDEFWLIEHDPVFTLGLAGKQEHLLVKSHDIPIVHCDRGGQITYHGPGQIVIYTLVNLERQGLSIRNFVERLELGIINFLSHFNLTANGDRSAPGVYVNHKKIASIGLKVKKGMTYHGISFNYNMDLTPFDYINVCGYSGLKVTQLADLTPLTQEIAQDALQLADFITSSIYG